MIVFIIQHLNCITTQKLEAVDTAKAAHIIMKASSTCVISPLMPSFAGKIDPSLPNMALPGPNTSTSRDTKIR